MTERKATDILAAIEAKLDHVTKQNNDLAFKLNLLLAKINGKPDTAIPAVSEKTVETLTVQVAKPIQEVKQNVTAPVVADNPDRMVTIQQKVLYPDSRGVALASVEFYPGDKEYEPGDIPLTKTKTNQVGKWSLKVKPGRYHIKIFKHPTSGKPKIDFFSSVEIPISNDSLELLDIK